MLPQTNQQTARATDPSESGPSTEPPMELNISETPIDLLYPKSDNKPKDKNTAVCYL